MMTRLEEEAKQFKASKIGTTVPSRKTKDQAEEEIKNLIQKSEEAATSVAMADTNINKEEVKMKLTKKDARKKVDTLVFYQEPAKSFQVEGILVGYKYNEFAQLVSVAKKGMVTVQEGTIWAEAVKKGVLTAVNMNIDDPEVRAIVVCDFIDKVAKQTLETYGKEKIVISKSIDKRRSVLYIGFRDAIENLLGVDASFKTPITKPYAPTFSQQIYAIEDKLYGEYVIRLLVVDPRINHVGINTVDGFCFINGVKVYQHQYISQRVKDKFEYVLSPERLPLLNVQLRCVDTSIIKGCVSLNAFGTEAADFAKNNGLELPANCQGAIDIECFKANVDGDHVKYRHGDVIEIPISDFRIINISSPKGSSSQGKQLTSTDPVAAKLLLEEARPEHKEDGLAEKARTFLAAGRGEAWAVLKVVNGTASFENNILQGQATFFSIPRDKSGKELDGTVSNDEVTWYAPRWNTVHKQMMARMWAYYTNSLIKTKTSSSSCYVGPHPCDLLDKLELKHLEETGEVVNYVIAANDLGKEVLIAEIENFRYMNAGRFPMQYAGALQEVLPLRVDENGEFILNPERIRNKEGRIYTTGCGHVQVSYRFISALNGDFDGDPLSLVFSNVAKFPTYRPKEIPDMFSKVEPEAEKKVTYTADTKAYIEALKKDYVKLIFAQGGIGATANFAMLLYVARLFHTGKTVTINGIERVCKPVPVQIGRLIADACQDAIDIKKHAEIDADTIKNIVKDLASKYYPNGKIPKGDAKPASFLLLHNSLGIGDENESNEEAGVIVRGAERMMIRLKNLIARANLPGQISEDDPYYALWTGLKGFTVTCKHGDSKYWKVKIAELWNNLDKTLGAKVSAETKAKVEKFAYYLNGDGSTVNRGYTFDEYKKEEIDMAKHLHINKYGDDFTFDPKDIEVPYYKYLYVRFAMEMAGEVHFSGYRLWSNFWREEDDEEAKKASFNQLKVKVQNARSAFLADICKDVVDNTDIHAKKMDAISKTLTICLGKNGFGSGISSKNNKAFSLPGYCFWDMPDTDKIWVAEKVHPANPYIKQYREKEAKKKLEDKTTKK